MCCCDLRTLVSGLTSNINCDKKKIIDTVTVWLLEAKQGLQAIIYVASYTILIILCKMGKLLCKFKLYMTFCAQF